jgi:hypothetical protein
MKFKFLKAAVAGVVLTVSGFANAGLIAVDFEAVFDQNSPVNLILGDFLYNDDTYELLDINLTVAGVARTTLNTGIHEFLGNWALGGLESGINTILKSDIGDFASVRTMIYTDGSTFHFSTAFSYTERAVDVQAPSTLAIFALGLMGLASRRFKKQS